MMSMPHDTYGVVLVGRSWRFALRLYAGWYMCLLLANDHKIVDT